MNLYALFMLITLISFLGFAVENLWMSITKGYMDNRNMVCPFLLGYGLAVIAIYFVLGTPRDFTLLGWHIPIENEILEILLYFLTVMVCVSLGEIVLGTAVEKLCGIVWWDYSSLPLHVTKYTSFFTSIGFTVLIVHFMDNVFLRLYDYFASWNTVFLSIASIMLMMVMLIDFVRSAYLMAKNKKLQQLWRWDIPNNPLYKLQSYFQEKATDGTK